MVKRRNKLAPPKVSKPRGEFPRGQFPKVEEARVLRMPNGRWTRAESRERYLFLLHMGTMMGVVQEAFPPLPRSNGRPKSDAVRNFIIYSEVQFARKTAARGILMIEEKDPLGRPKDPRPVKPSWEEARKAASDYLSRYWNINLSPGAIRVAYTQGEQVVESVKAEVGENLAIDFELPAPAEPRRVTKPVRRKKAR